MHVTPETTGDLQTRSDNVVGQVGALAERQSCAGIFCVAGGWAGGGADSSLAGSAERMYKQNVETSIITATLASIYLKPDGLVVFTGAAAAVDPTPSMLGYGMAKAAVHHLVRSLGAKDSGLPKGAKALAILP